MLRPFLKRLFFKNSHLSYSYLGEDRTFKFFFPEQTKGTYVDVGANHPVIYSNTYDLYQSGWSGLAIDPLPTHKKIFIKTRPRDVYAEYAIDATEGQKTFIITKDDRRSGLEENDQDLQMMTTISKKCTVKTIPLKDLLIKNNIPKKFEFLNIDVEGHELTTLKTLDLDLFRPKLILVEIHNFNISKASEHPIVKFMNKKQYKLHSYAMINAYFVEMTHSS